MVNAGRRSGSSEGGSRNMADDFMDGLFKEFARYLPKEDRADLRSLDTMYNIELAATKKDLVDDLYALRSHLHPQLLYTTGDDGTMNDIDWLIERKDRFLRPPAFESGRPTSEASNISTPDSISPEDQDMNPNSDKNFHRAYTDRLDRLSSTFANTLFGYYVNDLYNAELPYNITSSAFNKMGLGTSLFEDEEGDRRVGIDLSKIGLELFAYKFVPWTDSLEKSLGRPLNEGVVKATSASRAAADAVGKATDRYYVDMGLKPNVFSSISTAVTTPIHEIVHSISSHYTSRAYSNSIEKVFNSSFKDFKKHFSVTKDRGMLFGQIDEDVSNQLSERGIELRGKDLIDPFVMWEVVKRNGQQIADIIEQPADKFQKATYDYLSSYLPFRMVEEGIAINIALKNAGIDEVPSKLKGLEKSVKNIVKFGVDLERLKYLTRGVGFYTGENMMAGYYLPELQLYPVSYLYISNLADKHEEMDPQWYFQMASNIYRKKNLVKFGSPDFKKIQRDIQEMLGMGRGRSSLRQYRFSTPIVAAQAAARATGGRSSQSRSRRQEETRNPGPRQNPRIRTRGDGQSSSGSNRTRVSNRSIRSNGSSRSSRTPNPNILIDDLADSLNDTLNNSLNYRSGSNYEIESLVYDIREIGSYVFGNGNSGRRVIRSGRGRNRADIKDVLIDAGIHLALVFVLDRFINDG